MTEASSSRYLLEKTILLIVAISVPCFTLIEKQLGGAADSPHAIRWVITGLASIGLVLSWVVAGFGQYLRWLIIILIYLIVSQVVFLNYIYNFSYLYSALLVATVILYSVYFDQFKMVVAFQATIFLFVLQASFLSVNTIVDIGVFLSFYAFVNTIVVFIIYHAIRRRKQLAEAMENLEQTRAKLLRSNKELEQFAYIASHDLQEPLRTIRSYLQLIEKRYGNVLDDTGKEFFDFTLDAGERMQELIKALLQYSRVNSEKMKLEVLDLNAVLDNVKMDLQVIIDKEAATIHADDLGSLYGDKVQITRLVQNLVSNALKYRSEHTPVIHITARREDNTKVLSVADNGQGIPEQQQQNIFRIFNRLHTDDKGVGIGLAVARKIVQNHGGDIWVESTPGKGTTFHCSFETGQEVQ